MQIEIDRLRVQIKGRDAHIAELKAALTKGVDGVDSVRGELTKKDDEIRALRQTLVERDALVAAKDAALANKDAALVDKDQQIEALRQQQAAPRDPSAQGDDLKRIRGIGPGFERTLKESGVTTYAQMAAWTGDDILRIATLLNTQAGRIVRGGWIEQAAALVAGNGNNSTSDV